MKIFEFNWESDGYGSGIMLVAANKLEEAEDLAKSRSKYWKHDGFPARSDIKYVGKSKEPVIILEQYYQE